MKTNKYFLTFVGFLTGSICGISLISILSFTNAPGNPAAVNTPMTSVDANTFVKNYVASAVANNQVIKGFSLDRSQLDAMNSLARENQALAGFRIYLGKDGSGSRIGIVVGVDGNGKDATGNTIYNTAAQVLNVCPPVCDLSSPIIK